MDHRRGVVDVYQCVDVSDAHRVFFSFVNAYSPGEPAPVMKRFHSVQSYISQAAINGTSPTSTVFLGTLYEFTVKEQLERRFGMSLDHVGGANDGGRDLAGRWDISPMRQGGEPIPIRVGGKLIKPMLLRKSPIMDVFVQCKCFNTKIAAKELRELCGVLNASVRAQDKFRTLGVMCAPSTPTAQARTLMDQSMVPLVFCQVMEQRCLGDDPYDVRNYEGSTILGQYLNPLAIALLQGVKV